MMTIIYLLSEHHAEFYLPSQLRGESILLLKCLLDVEYNKFKLQMNTMPKA